MKVKESAVVILIVISLFTGNAWGAAAAPVSPGDATVLSVISQNCPTFSWSSAGEVTAYRLEVYEQMMFGLLSRNEISSTAKPIILKEIGVPTLSWTPAEGECLERGSQYVWYVQGLDAAGEGQWSQGIGFRVAASALSLDQKEAINALLKEYLATEAGKTALLAAAREAAVSTGVMTQQTGLSKNRQAAGLVRAPVPNAPVSPTGLKVDQDGSVDIGTAAAAAKLDVSGNAIFSGASQQMLYVIGSDAGGTWMNLQNTSAGGRSWGLISSGSSNGEGAGKLLIRDHAASAIRATFDTNGNVGIGQDFPAAKLDVNGDIKAQNMPAIKSVQTYRPWLSPVAFSNFQQDVDTLSVNVPSTGSLELMATLEGEVSNTNVMIFSLSETTSLPATQLVASQITFTSGGSNVIALHWVLPTSPGMRSFKTSIQAVNSASQVYRTTTLTARFFPASL